jgi:hypothetical protein
MPVPSRTVRLVLAFACATALAAATAHRAAPLGPTLEIEVRQRYRGEVVDLFEVRVRARGGETVPKVRVEAASETARVANRPYFVDLPPDLTVTFSVQVDRGGPGRVNVVQEGRVARVYPVLVRAARP